MSPTKKKVAKKKKAAKKKKVAKKKAVAKKKTVTKKKTSRTKRKSAGKVKKASSRAKTAKKPSPRKTIKKRGGSGRPVEEPVIPKQMRKDVYGVYEKAVGLLGQGKIDQAQKLLIKILNDYPDETEVLARVRNFLKVCEKRLAKEVRTPRSAETLFSQGVFFHNSGEFQRALESYAQALELSGKEKDHIYYAMAASEYSLGDTDAALRNLKKAISGNPENRYYAQNDPDFRDLSDHKKFQALVQPE